ncbi:ClpXP adapter SpxH family protein [Bacillus benzoevorans]|uniref:ClpXP adapter protein SpxH n=1 Tax=Bacillus benzoevorans TaxID=1456 RepID=A0A7X0HMT8_9BACI|nr:putative DsbA family dithiol-disulfide isomerase [Bacillus benzoevorans]
MTKREVFARNSSSYPCHCHDKKSLEIYMFIDPLCPECWALEPVLKKLHIEYGQYFTFKYVVSGRLANLNLGRKHNFEKSQELWEKTGSRFGMSCDGSLWLENPISAPYLTFIAIKAAELQGRKAGIRFLRKLQEMLFLEKQNVATLDVLITCADLTGLDVEEFVCDIHSDSAAKAFQCDLKITSEMDVTEIPTLVFFNENIEEEGIKITGIYPYEIYVQIMEEMLEEKPVRSEPPPLEIFLRHYHFVSSMEIALIYNMNVQDVERELKKLQLKQIVEKVPAKHGAFWKLNTRKNLAR